jgi:hypothetical protein
MWVRSRGQVVAAFGQQPQDGGLVLGYDLTQPRVVPGDVGDAGRVRGIGFCSGRRWPAAGRERPSWRARRRTVSLAAANCWAMPRAEPIGAHNGESALRPPGRPPGQLGESARR